MSDYEVGYKKPPKHTQFKPGESGNYAGRPRKDRTAKGVLRAELNKKVTVTENGVRTSYTKFELIYASMVNAAVKGDMRAAKEVFSTIRAMGLDREQDTMRSDLADNGVVLALIEKLQKTLQLRGQAELYHDLYRKMHPNRVAPEEAKKEGPGPP